MPAVTVEDVLTLPRISAPDPVASSQRVVKSVTTAPAGFEGEGFPVRRAFAGTSTTELDPFIHMDQMGEIEYAPGEPKGTPWHPHRGFETVTYMIDGTFDHQDSNGGGGRITNGDTQWMTAGAGILHIEAPPEELVATGGLFHGIQLWVNLPRANKWNPPAYQDIRGREATLLTTMDGGALLRVIAGDVGGHSGPGSTFTPITLVHATLSPGARAELPWREDFNALVYVLAGTGSVGAEQRPIESGQLAVFGSGDTLTLTAGTNARGEPEFRGPAARRPADPRTGRSLRTFRHEHQGRDRPGARGLPGRTSRDGPRPYGAAPSPGRRRTGLIDSGNTLNQMADDAIAFPTLDESELAVLDSLGTRRPVQLDEFLYREGDASYDFYAIRSGAVEITVRDGDEEKVIAQHGPGRFLGELNLLTGMRVYVSARDNRGRRGHRGAGRGAQTPSRHEARARGQDPCSVH